MISTKTAAMKHLEYLCVAIGPRPLGSKANQAAADYVQRAFEAAGLAVETQEFPCPLWEEVETHLEVGGERLTAFANTWSPPCDVTVPAVALGTVAELEAAELTGRIGILYGDLTKGHGYGARGAYYFPEEHQQIVRLLEAKRPAALLADCFFGSTFDRAFVFSSAQMVIDLSIFSTANSMASVFTRLPVKTLIFFLA